MKFQINKLSKMKTTINFFFIVSVMLALSACNGNTPNASTDTDTSSSISADTGSMDTANSRVQDTMKMQNELMAAMKNSIDKMNAVQMSGDFDKDFAAMMIQHHQGAIDMSKIEVAQGTDEKMKAVAQNVITKQTDEQKKLKDMMDKMKPSSMKMGEDEMQKSMTDMQSKINGMQMTGNVDKDFAMMMVSHHEDGIAMSKLELKNGMNAELKQMAKKVIDDQQKEIKELESWITSFK